MAPEDEPPAGPRAVTDAGAAPRSYRQIRFTSPVGATELLLVRHGESEAADPDQPFPLVDGRGDPELSSTGRLQAALVADRLGATRIDAIYVTSLRRTVETAAPLAQRLGLAPEVEPALAEVRLGEWEGGRYRQRIAEGDPLAARIFEEERWDLIPGAESNAAIAARGGLCDRADRRAAQRWARRVRRPRRHDRSGSGYRDRFTAVRLHRFRQCGYLDHRRGRFPLAVARLQRPFAPRLSSSAGVPGSI